MGIFRGRKARTDAGAVVSDRNASRGDLDALKGYAWNANLTNKQFRDLAKQLDSQMVEVNTQAKEQYESGFKALKAEWGQAYEDRMAAVANVLENAPTGLRDSFINGTMRAEDVRYFHSISALAPEGQTIAAQENKHTGKLTPEEAGHRLRELENKYKDIRPSDPDWERFINRRVELVGMTMG